MKKLALTAVGLLLLASTALAGVAVDYRAVSASQTNTTVTLSFQAKSAVFFNNGSNEVYVNIGGGGVAATSGVTNMMIPAGEKIAVDASNSAGRLDVIGVICDTGETTTLRIYALQ